MTAMDIKRDSPEYTAEEVTAYEAYLAAVAEHNIVCARRGATSRDKMDAATAQLKAFGRFCEVAGHPIAGARSPVDIRAIEGLTKQLRELTELIRSAYSMLHGIQSIGAFQYVSGPEDDHNACCTLLDDAALILRKALAKADAA